MAEVLTKDELTKLLYYEIEAAVECEADANNAFQEGYSVGFNDCRARVLTALLGRVLGQSTHHDTNQRKPI